MFSQLKNRALFFYLFFPLIFKVLLVKAILFNRLYRWHKADKSRHVKYFWCRRKKKIQVEEYFFVCFWLFFIVIIIILPSSYQRHLILHATKRWNYKQFLNNPILASSRQKFSRIRRKVHELREELWDQLNLEASWSNAFVDDSRRMMMHSLLLFGYHCHCH